MEDFIRTENLEFQYINEDEQGGQAISVDVLKGVSMEVKQGEFVALLGHNGSGKSTMAKQFNAMLLPMGGKVYVDGMDTLDDDKSTISAVRSAWCCRTRTTSLLRVSSRRT